MELIFNIIFTPGTVRYLRLSVLSLLEFSPYRYRLVSNGLKREELLLLKNFCQTDPRLEFHAYPTPRVIPHGTLITLLELGNTSDFFCFMDSDIFASKTFDRELEEYLKDCDVFSSCNYIGRLPEERPKGFRGYCLQTPNGLPLATTFFSVYRRELLRKVIEETGISFEMYQFPELIPDRVISWLKEMNIEMGDYDTAKLMNILAHRFGLRFKYHSIEGLFHVGGVSRALLRLASGKPKRSLWSRVADLSGINRSGQTGKSQQINNPVLDLQRVEMGEFFATYLKWLFGEGEEPVWKMTASPLDQRVLRLCEVIRDLHRRHERLLTG